MTRRTKKKVFKPLPLIDKVKKELDNSYGKLVAGLKAAP